MTTRVAVLCACFVGCNGGGGPARAPDEPIASPEPPPVEETPEAPTAEPATDETPASPPGAGQPCENKIALHCESGFMDGCDLPHPKDKNRRLTTHHVCVPEKEKGGPPCEQEIARVCPDGQVDACLTQPVFADNHACIVKP